MAFPAILEDVPFLRDKHVNYCRRHLGVLPFRCQSMDSTRLVIAFFAISALDLMDSLSEIEDEKQEIIDWVYCLQVLPQDMGSSNYSCGFRGSTSCTVDTPHGKMQDPNLCDKAHVAMTYTALSILIILGDDLSRINKKRVLTSLKKLQLPNGSFQPISVDCESDMRFVYCASCICYILNDWSGMDRGQVIQYIKNSLSYEGGIAQGPGLEAHGGSTFCAIATLYLMEKLEDTFSCNQLKQLRRWCLFRQQTGFQGRPNKPVDTCYAFWIGATLKLLSSYHLIDCTEVLKSVLTTQDNVTGGIAKWSDQGPDILHTYLGISGLSLMNFESFLPVHPALNFSQRAADNLVLLHKQWNNQPS